MSEFIHRHPKSGARNWALLFFLVREGDHLGWKRELAASKAEIQEDFSWATKKNDIPALIEFALNNACADFLLDVIKITSFPWDYRDCWGRSLVHYLFEPSRHTPFVAIPWRNILECVQLLIANGLDLGEPYPTLPSSFSSAKCGVPLWLYTIEQKQWDLAVALFPTDIGGLDPIKKMDEQPRESPEDRIFYNFCAVLVSDCSLWPTSVLSLASHWLKWRGFQSKDIKLFPVEECWPDLPWEDRQKILQEWSIPDKNNRTRFHEKLGILDSPAFSDMVEFLLLNQELLVTQDDWQEKPWEVWMLAWSSCGEIDLTCPNQKLLDWWGGQARETLLPVEVLQTALHHLTKKVLSPQADNLLS